MNLDIVEEGLELPLQSTHDVPELQESVLLEILHLFAGLRRLCQENFLQDFVTVLDWEPHLSLQSFRKNLEEFAEHEEGRVQALLEAAHIPISLRISFLKSAHRLDPNLPTEK